MHASSDHIYALVATPETAKKPPQNEANVAVQLRPLSMASEGAGFLEDPDKTNPNLLDMIPPPPHYPPPTPAKLALGGLKPAGQQLSSGGLKAATQQPPAAVPARRSQAFAEQDFGDVSDLYSKVNKSKTAASNNANTGTNSARRRKLRKNSSAAGKSNNCDNSGDMKRSASAAVADWKSLDDADSSSSESDVPGGGTDLSAAGELRPDVVQQCSNGNVQLASPTNANHTPIGDKKYVQGIIRKTMK